MLPYDDFDQMKYNNWPTVGQLKAVFQLCDQENTGMVRVEHLQELAKFYTSEDTQVIRSQPSYFLITLI